MPPAKASRVMAFSMAATLGCCAPRFAAASTLGVYGGNDPANVTQFETWLGCRATQVLVFTDGRSWRNIASPEWFVGRFNGLDRPAVWSVPMIPPGGNLEASATGRYNSHYVSAAQVLAHARPDSHGLIRMRFGWELNGDWFPWAAKGKAKAFSATFQNMVRSFRSVSSAFRFEWNINYGGSMDPAEAYPGDDYVDVVGMDFYWMPEYQGNDPEAAFIKIRDDRYGLQYITELAATHHKPVAFSEWGVRGDNAAPFINLVSEWIKSHNTVYHNYWNSDAAYPGRLSGGRWPQSGAAFRRDFCH
jgi:hypothetical protein